MSNRKNYAVRGFVKTDGRRMVNENGETVILRGWGAGNWTNPEGFMVGGCREGSGEYYQPNKLDRGRSMDLVIRELCGTEYAKNFWPRWYRAHLNEKDIKAMADAGYNCVRLVLNAASFLYEEPGYQFNEDTFRMLDEVLDACEKYRVYAVLDLHAAPGGQTAGGCDNGVDNVPHLFIDDENWERTIVLWETFAKRYCDRWIIAGYDLLNEPLNTLASLKYTDKLIRFYDELIPRIRAIDKNHMLILEGTIWSTQVSIFTHNYDPICNNWCIQVHIYGFTPEIAEIYAMNERADELNVPIWMGEGGSDKVADSIFLDILAKENIGFCLWVWKSAGRGFGEPLSTNHELPKDWNLVHDYAESGGPKPGFEKSMAIFDEYLELLDYDRCIHPTEGAHYILRQPGITIPAVGFDHGMPDIAYHGEWHYGNAYGYRIETPMKMVVRDGAERPGPKAVWNMAGHNFMNMPSAIKDLYLNLRTGEFVHYSIYDVEDSCDVVFKAYSKNGGTIKISAAGFEETIRIEAAESPQEYKCLKLPKGDAYAVRTECIEGDVILAEVSFL